MHKRGLTAATITATTVLALAVAATGDASAAPAPTAVPHTKPAWTAHAKQLGHAKDSAKVNARVYLAPRGGLDATKKLATAVSTPGSAQYGKYLSTAQYEARFEPTSSTVKSVTSYLRSSGLKVGKASAGHRYLTITGTTKAARKAFGARIDKYNHNGRTVQAPSKNLTVPASLKTAVLTVTGLDTTPKTIKPASKQSVPPGPGFRNARPCSIYYGQIAAKYKADYKTTLPKFQGKTLPYAPCGYTGPQYRAAYEGDTELDGKGITVAITDAYASPTIVKDTTTYADNHGDAGYAKGQYYETKAKKFTYEGPDECDAAGWYGEQTLDVEAVHAMAGSAKIHYYGAASCQNDDFLDTLAKVVDDNDAQLVTNSWGDAGEQGETADIVAANEAIFTQGAIQGISFMFSSGDNGDELANTGIKQADYPASDPYVTAVGGTATAISPDATTGVPTIAFQTGWGTSNASLAADGKSWTTPTYLYGAGGGTSALFNRPSYQDGTTSSPYRQVPDVAMDADPQTGMLIGITQTFSDGVKYDEYRIGGTSLASPLFAGITALKLQAAKAKKGLGLLNPVIYKNKALFSDVKGAPKDAGVVRVNYVNGENAKGGLSYFVRTFNTNGTLKTGPGYDLVTGVGVPKTAWFTPKLAS